MESPSVTCGTILLHLQFVFYIQGVSVQTYAGEFIAAVVRHCVERDVTADDQLLDVVTQDLRRLVRAANI